MTDPEIEIARSWLPGLLGETAAWHARVHSRNHGLGWPFEAIVARGMAEFIDAYDPARDLLLSAWQGERFAGTITIDGRTVSEEPGAARLRWFVVPRPGRGLGARLIDEAMAFLDARGLACWLTSLKGLEAAGRLYTRHGFRVTHESEDTTWGTRVTEQRWDRPAAS